jgi:hypothetical protein
VMHLLCSRWVLRGGSIAEWLRKREIIGSREAATTAFGKDGRLSFRKWGCAYYGLVCLLKTRVRLMSPRYEGTSRRLRWSGQSRAAFRKAVFNR